MHRFLTVVSVLACSHMAQAATPAKPNIIFILSDDLAQGDLGCYGQQLIQTPNLPDQKPEFRRDPFRPGLAQGFGSA